MTIRVIPRVETRGEHRGNVFLVLPDMRANAGMMLIYDPNDGHSEASIEWIRRSRPARLEEYETLVRRYGQNQREPIVVAKRRAAPRY